MAAEVVGAALVLDGRAAFVADARAAAAGIDTITTSADAATAALDRMAAAQARTAEAGKATAATTAATTDLTEAEVAAGGAIAGKTAATDAEVLATSKKVEATKAATAAVKDHETALTSLAGNSAIKGMATFGLGALAAGAYETIKQYTTFNKLVTQSAVDAGLPAKDLKNVQQDLIGLSREYGISLNDAANSAYRVFSAMSGTHATLKSMMTMVGDSAKMDVLFNVPAGNSTEQLARVMGALNNAKLAGATTPDKIMALANVTVGRGDIRGADLIGALGQMLPAAKAMGANAVDMSAWVDMLTKEGMQGSRAGTLIAHSVQQLAHPSEQGQKAEQMLGIEPNGPNSLASMLQSKGIGATVDYLTSHAQKFQPLSYYPKFGTNAAGPDSAMAQLQAWGILSPTQIQQFQAGTLTGKSQENLLNSLLSKIFGGAKSALPMLALTSNEAGYNDIVKSLQQGATPQALAHSLELAMNTPGRQMQIARANIAATGAEIGQELTPAALDAFHALEGFAKWLAGNAAALDTLLVTIGTVVGGSVIVVATQKLINFVSAIGKIGGTIASLAGKVSNFLFGTNFGGAGSAGPDEIFAGSVTEFSGAVTEFSASSKLGGLGRAGGAAGAAEGAAGAGEAGAAGAAGAAGLGEAGLAGAAGVEAAGVGAAGGSLAVFAVGAAALVVAVAGLNKVINHFFPGLGPPGTAQSTIPPASGKAPGTNKLPSDWEKPNAASTQLVGTSPVQHHSVSNKPFPFWQTGLIGGNKFPPAPNIPNVPSSWTSGTLSALKKSTQGIPLFGPQLTNNQLSAQESKASESATKQAAKQLSTAAQDHIKAAELLYSAGDKHSATADKWRAEGDKMESAAKQHQQAAKDLSAAALAVARASTQLANTPIQATVSQAQVAAASQQQAADTTART